MLQCNTLADYFSENTSCSKIILEIETGEKKTHQEVFEKAIQISNNDYINSNQIVTVILPNSITYIEHFLAAMLGGYIFNPLPYFTQTQELEKVQNQLESKQKELNAAGNKLGKCRSNLSCIGAP